MEQMSVHKGLAELKLLGDRTHRAIVDGIYCTHNKRSNQKIAGMEIKDCEDKVIRAGYDKVVSLLGRRQRIKSAIVKSNAVTMVEIAGVKMSVAEAIDRKSSIEYDKFFLDALKKQYSHTLGIIEGNNSDLTERADSQINALYDNKESVDPKKIQTLKDDYINENTFDLIDPINIREKIEVLEKQIEDFLLEVDFKLSESNALTMIDI